MGNLPAGAISSHFSASTAVFSSPVSADFEDRKYFAPSRLRKGRPSINERWRSEHVPFLLGAAVRGSHVSPAGCHHSLNPHVPSSKSPQFLGCCEHVSGVGECKPRQHHHPQSLPRGATTCSWRGWDDCVIG